MTCPDCKGSGTVMSKHGGIGLLNGKWHTYSGPVTCWRCSGSGVDRKAMEAKDG